MSFWRKIIGYSQREIWHRVAIETGACFIFGNALEGDRIEYAVKGYLVSIYITTKGNSWYTVFESFVKRDLPISESFQSKNTSLTVIPHDSEEPIGYTYFLQMKDEGIIKDPELLKARMSFFADVVESSLNKK